MKTLTITITVPDGVDVQVSSQPAQNGPGQAQAPQGGSTPVCPKHGPEKVKPSTKFSGFYCTAPDDSGPRGYCTWSVK